MLLVSKVKLPCLTSNPTQVIRNNLLLVSWHSILASGWVLDWSTTVTSFDRLFAIRKDRSGFCLYFHTSRRMSYSSFPANSYFSVPICALGSSPFSWYLASRTLSHRLVWRNLSLPVYKNHGSTNTVQKNSQQFDFTISDRNFITFEGSVVLIYLFESRLSCQ